MDQSDCRILGKCIIMTDMRKNNNAMRVDLDNHGIQWRGVFYYTLI